jgi:hypothetical protein
VVTIFFRRRRERERQEKVRQQIERRRSQLYELLGDVDSGRKLPMSLTGVSYSDIGLLAEPERSRFHQLREEQLEKQRTKKKLKQLQKLRQDLVPLWKKAEASEGIERIDLLLAFYAKVRYLHNRQHLVKEAIGISLDAIRDSLQQAVQQEYERLVFLRDDRDSFIALVALILRTRSSTDNGWRNLRLVAGIKDLPYPDNWNDLVARHYGTPPFELFIGQPERGMGDVRLLAAEAIRTGDLALAQIALAYCNKNKTYRAAVGDVLLAELAKLVEAKLAEIRSHPPVRSELD